MKKLTAVALVLLMLVGSFGFTAFAETEALTANVYVTVANKGKLVVTQEAVTVTDIDNDGALTVNDALYAAHESNYEGGAEAGYAYAETDYGISIAKLWGDESGSYGYYVNNASAMSLADTVKEGDYLNAFVYTDLTAWSDKYCFFSVNEIEGETDKNIELTLSAAGYDAEWNPITVPVEGAVITVDGVATEVKTDAEGKATVKIDEGGTFVISATSQSSTLVPPVCVATVNEAEVIPDVSEDESSKEESKEPPTNAAGDTSDMIVFAVIAVIALAGITFSVRKRSYEN